MFSKINLFKLLKKHLILIILLLILIPVFLLLYKIHIPRISAFGCFDDCNNFMGGYFLLQGKSIFSEFFFNHLPMAAFVSFLIQKFTSPENIYELLLRHRQFMLLLSFCLSFLLVFRFRLPALIFVVIFEFSKFYLFGDRFLSEGMIVYPVVYLAGIIFLRLNSQKIFSYDLIFASLFTWFVVFSREPYVPLALFLFAVIIFQKNAKDVKKTPLIFFTIICFITLFSMDIKELFFNVVTVNYQSVLPAEEKSTLPGLPIVQSIFYTIFVFLFGPLNHFKILLIAVNALFLLLLANLFVTRKFLLATTLVAILALSNIRVVDPGKIFYGAFHMLIWYGLLIFISLLILFKNKLDGNLKIFCMIFLGVVFSYFVFSPNHFAYEKIDPHTEFITNYGNYLQEGEVIKLLSGTDDKLFLDASDDLIYWQSQRNSDYKYSWFTSAMIYFPKYNDARLEMFRESPPDFYREYGSCPKKIHSGPYLPVFVQKDYINLASDGKPSCLYVRREKITEISDEQWQKASEWRYNLPNEKN